MPHHHAVLYRASKWKHQPPQPSATERRGTLCCTVELHCIPFLLIADGPDYTGGLLTATFRGTSTASVQVPTLSDNVLEGLETFTGVIQEPPDPRVTRGSPDTATVNIFDATSKFIINFCAD